MVTKIYFMIKVYTHFMVNKPQNLYHLLLILQKWRQPKKLRYPKKEDDLKIEDDLKKWRRPQIFFQAQNFFSHPFPPPQL